MKVAILFSGQVRTFDETYPYIKRNLLDGLDDYDIFCSVSSLEDVEKVKTMDKKIVEVYKKKTVDINKIAKEILKNNIWAGFGKASCKNALLQFEKIKHSFDIMKSFEKENGIRYDAIIRMRYDLMPIKKIFTEEIIKKLSKGEIVMPTRDRRSKEMLNMDKQVTDIFAIMNREDADVYFNTINNFKKMSEQYNIEKIAKKNEKKLIRFLNTSTKKISFIYEKTKINNIYDTAKKIRFFTIKYFLKKIWSYYYMGNGAVLYNNLKKENKKIVEKKIDFIILREKNQHNNILIINGIWR